MATFGIGEAIALAGIALTAASTAAAYKGSQNQAKSQAYAADYQSQVAQNEATVANQNADIAKQYAERDALALRQRGEKILGANRVAVAGSGIGFSGSALDVMDETSTNVELDALDALNQGQRQSWNFKVGANSAMAKSQLLDAQSGYAKQAGSAAGTSALISGASSAVGQAGSAYQNYQAKQAYPSFNKR